MLDDIFVHDFFPREIGGKVIHWNEEEEDVGSRR